ncbi:MAG: NUDIX domain-containing protein [Bacteroidetes bacterium]|nr:NUDIX domain-containing protein [Bacteroidota bacterium]
MNRFNLRAYGILRNEKNQILVSIELRNGKHMIKFPGGGLEWGEGLAECLVREWREELDVTIEVKELFYVNEFKQISVFNTQDQLISFYYNVVSTELNKISTVDHNFLPSSEGEFPAWFSISQLKEIEFTFPIDRLVVEMIINQVD